MTLTISSFLGPSTVSLNVSIFKLLNIHVYIYKT